jgi:hypothetical protein
VSFLLFCQAEVAGADGKDNNSEKDDKNEEYTSLLNASLDSVLVSAGSPRLRIAFDLLLKDPRVVETKNGIDYHLKVKGVKDKLERRETQKKKFIEERTKFVFPVTFALCLSFPELYANLQTT